MSAFGNFIVKKNNNNYYLEIWGGSTKHPDLICSMENFEVAEWVDKSNEVQMKTQVFQWLLKCASELYSPFTAQNLVEYALENWKAY